MMDIVLATRNPDKISEITAILAPLSLRVLTIDDFEGVPEVVEDGTTLADNALKKARVVRDATGYCALADDTGLEVDALDGAPGVYSSRYAGEGVTYDDNNRKLLADMAAVPKDARAASFRCVMALALTTNVADAVRRRGGALAGDDAPSDSGSRFPGAPDALLTEGIVHGGIVDERRGGGGFGYDPVFEVEGMGRTLAELSVDEKNRISHRYRALIEMRALMIRAGLAAERDEA